MSRLLTQRGRCILLAAALLVACKSESETPQESTSPEGAREGASADATPAQPAPAPAAAPAAGAEPPRVSLACTAVVDGVWAFVADGDGPYADAWGAVMTVCAAACGSGWRAPTLDEALAGAAALRAKALTQFWTATEDMADTAKAVVYEDGAAEADMRTFAASKASLEVAVCRKG